MKLYLLALVSALILILILYRAETRDNRSDSSGTGTYIIGQVGERVERGDVLRGHSDGKYYRADADSAITMPAIAMAMDAGATNAYVRLLLHGQSRMMQNCSNRKGE